MKSIKLKQQSIYRFYLVKSKNFMFQISNVELVFHKLSYMCLFNTFLLNLIGSLSFYLQRMQSFIRKCLEKAHEYQYSSLAFPALGTGNLSFPSKVVAEIAKETIEEFEGAHETTTIKTIAFIIYVKDEDTFKVLRLLCSL